MEKIELSVKLVNKMVDSWIPKEYNVEQVEAKKIELFKPNQKKLLKHQIVSKKKKEEKKELQEKIIQKKKKPVNFMDMYLKK
ncbi:hypothetical protein HDV06_002950 [Boothiomyces sp. JEL0866]|nr:hypothetical protein HDV06_002950 [Boothiomyces sp. JEL0866]